MQLGNLRRRGLTLRYLALASGEAFSKLCVLAAFGHLARTFTPAEYGLVEFALSMTVFFVLGVEGGMGAYGAKVVSTHPGDLPSLVPRIMLLRAIAGVPTFAIVLILANASTAPGMDVLAINAFAILLTPLLTQWVFQGLGQMQWVAWGSVVRYSVFAVLVLGLVRPGSSIRLAAIAEVTGIAALAVFNCVLLYGRLRLRLNLRDGIKGLGALLGQVWPLGLSDFSWACLWYSPTIIVGWVAGSEQVAWIGAAIRLVIALHTFVWLYFFNLLPNLTQALAADVSAWRVLIERSLRTSMWPATLVAVGGSLGAPFFIPMIYGAAFTAAVLPFQIVIWIIPIAWFSGHYRFSLIAAGQQRWEFAALAVSAVVTIALSIGLGTKWGSTGVAVAFITGGVLNTVLAGVACSQRVGDSAGFAATYEVAITAFASLVLGLLVTNSAGTLGGVLAGCATFVGVGVWRNRSLLRAAVT